MKNGKYILTIAPNEYPGKKYRGRYAYEHIVQFWKREGRLPADGCVVHHKNDDKHDNSFENLEEILKSDHSRLHQLEIPITHGTHSGYRRGCRCVECKNFHTLEHRKYREKVKLKICK